MGGKLSWANGSLGRGSHVGATMVEVGFGTVIYHPPLVNQELNDDITTTPDIRSHLIWLNLVKLEATWLDDSIGKSAKTSKSQGTSEGYKLMEDIF